MQAGEERPVGAVGFGRDQPDSPLADRFVGQRHGRRRPAAVDLEPRNALGQLQRQVQNAHGPIRAWREFNLDGGESALGLSLGGAIGRHARQFRRRSAVAAKRHNLERPVFQRRRRKRDRGLQRAGQL